MLEKYNAIVGRIGIILLITGLIVLLRRLLKFTSRFTVLNSSLVTYLGVGLVIAGSILVAIFIYFFVKRKHK
jgi:hypothetical protein